MPAPRRRRAVKVEVETERIEGRIELADVVRRVEKAATRHARAARRDPKISGAIEERLHTVAHLASELAGHLEELDAVLPPERRPSGPARGDAASGGA